MSGRAEALASRVEEGARGLAAFVEGLSEAEWRLPVPGDGRTIGVLVHHVASVYPLEVDLAQAVAQGTPVAGVTYDGEVAAMNARHAREHRAVTKEDALRLLLENSRTAAERIRRFTDEELDRAAPVSLNANAPLTAQFVIEDHAVRHSYHHLSRIKAAVGR